MEIFFFTVVLMIFLIVGIPAAFSLLLSCILLYVAQRGLGAIPYSMVAHRVVYGLDSFPLLAIPLFILVGQLMNTSGITDRIFNFARACVGHFRAGLAHVNVLASLIFAGMSGSAVADAAGLGAIEIKAMKDEGYDEEFSVGVTAGSALIGPILPPSIPVVLYAIFAKVSVNRLLIAGFIPGLLMAACLMIYVSIIAKKRNYPVHDKANIHEFWATLKKAFFPLLTPVILVGGIITGIFTATEAAAVASLYSVILFLVYTKGAFSSLLLVFQRSIIISSGLLIILAAAQLYSSLVIRSRIPILITESLFSITSNYWLIMIFLVFFLLLAGCFLSTAVSINILTAFLVPLVIAIGGDPLYFGIIMITTLMIGQLTPPFGLVLYAIMGIVDMPFERLVKSVLPFILPVLVVLLLLLIFPRLVTFLPNLLM